MFKQKFACQILHLGLKEVWMAEIAHRQRARPSESDWEQTVLRAQPISDQRNQVVSYMLLDPNVQLSQEILVLI